MNKQTPYDEDPEAKLILARFGEKHSPSATDLDVVTLFESFAKVSEERKALGVVGKPERERLLISGPQRFFAEVRVQRSDGGNGGFQFFVGRKDELSGGTPIPLSFNPLEKKFEGELIESGVGVPPQHRGALAELCKAIVGFFEAEYAPRKSRF